MRNPDDDVGRFPLRGAQEHLLLHVAQFEAYDFGLDPEGGREVGHLCLQPLQRLLVESRPDDESALRQGHAAGSDGRQHDD